MSGAGLTPDPHGYARLHRYLAFIAQECREVGVTDVAERIETAVAFYGAGSPTEFLGEASLALRELISSPRLIPQPVRVFANAVEDEIREGFTRVEGG